MVGIVGRVTTPLSAHPTAPAGLPASDAGLIEFDRTTHPGFYRPK
jgi:hypothetical protein